MTKYIQAGSPYYYPDKKKIVIEYLNYLPEFITEASTGAIIEVNEVRYKIVRRDYKRAKVHLLQEDAKNR